MCKAWNTGNTGQKLSIITIIVTFIICISQPLMQSLALSETFVRSPNFFLLGLTCIEPF